MKVTTVASPNDVKQVTSNESALKAKAIAAFNKGQQTTSVAQPQPEHPVSNPNNISAEELSAINAPTQEVAQSPETAQIVDNPTITEDTAKAAPEESPAKTEKEVETEKKFAEIARQERILRAKAQKQAQELKTQQDALNAQKAALDQRQKELEQGYISKDKFKQDPLSALTDAEVSYDELTQRILNQQPRDPRVDAEIKALRDELKAVRTANEEAQKASKTHQDSQYQAAVKQLERDTQALVNANPADYEAISKTNATKEVVELIERTYKEDGILLSVQEAAQEVENYLVEEGYNTFSKIDKIKKRLAEASASTASVKVEEKKTQAEPKQTQPMKTLTNATASSRKLSSRERAILAFKGELK